MSFIRRLFGLDESAPPAPAPTSTSPSDEIPALGHALQILIRRVNAAAGRLPVGAVPEAREIGDKLLELLEHAERRVEAGSPLDTYAMITLASTINDYLPTSIGRYLALPEAYLASHRNADGQTADEELLTQLDLMKKGVAELAEAIYSGDAQQLATQGRFLDAKFAKSDLDL